MPFALCENVLAIGSRKATFDGDTSLLLQPANFFTKTTLSVLRKQRHRLESSYFLLKLFNISIPVAKELLKHTSARTVHAKVIVKPARVV